LANEDLTTYTNAGGSNIIVESAYNNETVVFKVDESYSDKIFKDYDTNHFQDFEVDFLCCIFDSYAGLSTDNDGQVAGAYFTNTVTGYGYIDNNSDDAIYFMTLVGGGNTVYYYLKTFINGEENNDMYTGIRNFDYYYTLTRERESVILEIYSDSARTTLLDTLTSTVTNVSFRYMLAAACDDETTETDDITGRLGYYNFKNVDCQFKITQSTSSVYLSTPETLTFTDSKGIQQFYFWNDSSVVIDIGKESEEITLSGIENKRGRSKSITSVMYDVDEMVENGTSIEIDDLGIDDIINTTWFIKEFSYTLNSGETDACSWSLTLEKDY